jgi:hypothetical protein
MKNISTGTGIALLAGAIVAYPIIDRVMPRAEAGATHVAAVVTAATAQVPPEPTIVWYGTQGTNVTGFLYRAWSDGKVEMRGWYWPSFDPCNPSNFVPPCRAPWVIINDPAQGLTYRSDINFDSKVDGADLSQVLNDWGDAPRQDIPPSTCPLNLINP